MIPAASGQESKLVGYLTVAQPHQTVQVSGSFNNAPLASRTVFSTGQRLAWKVYILHQCTTTPYKFYFTSICAERESTALEGDTHILDPV